MKSSEIVQVVGIMALMVTAVVALVVGGSFVMYVSNGHVEVEAGP